MVQMVVSAPKASSIGGIGGRLLAKVDRVVTVGGAQVAADLPTEQQVF